MKCVVKKINLPCVPCLTVKVALFTLKRNSTMSSTERIEVTVKGNTIVENLTVFPSVKPKTTLWFFFHISKARGMLLLVGFGQSKKIAAPSCFYQLQLPRLVGTFCSPFAQVSNSAFKLEFTTGSRKKKIALSVRELLSWQRSCIDACGRITKNPISPVGAACPCRARGLPWLFLKGVMTAMGQRELYCLVA